MLTVLTFCAGAVVGALFPEKTLWIFNKAKDLFMELKDKLMKKEENKE